MAIKNIIAKGIGFSPGSVMYIVTHGFSIGVVTSIWAAESDATTAWGAKTDAATGVWTPKSDNSTTWSPS